MPHTSDLPEIPGLPRGAAEITTENRGAVRQWIISAGLPSAYVRALTLRDLSTIYNDTTGAALRDHAQLSGGGQAQPTARPAGDLLSGIPTPPPSAPTPPSAQTDVASAIAAALAPIMAGMRPATAGLTADDVRAIVADTVQGMARTVVEVRTPTETRKIERLHHAQTADLLAWLAVGEHVWLAGPPGSGKSTAAEVAAEALGLPFYCTGAISSEHRLLGFTTATGATVRTPFREAFEHGGLFLWDEIDASSPNALVMFNQALANRVCAFPDGVIRAHDNFVAVAGANTYGTGATAEFVGRLRQDAATIDRFVRIYWDYDRDMERTIADGLAGADGVAWARKVWKYRDAAQRLGIRAVFSPRTIIRGCKALAAGKIPASALTETLLHAGLDDATTAKLAAEAA